jgi:hypothetical protein
MLDLRVTLYQPTTATTNSVAAKWKLTYNAEDYDIVSVAPEGRRRFLLVKTTLRDNGTG